MLHFGCIFQWYCIDADSLYVLFDIVTSDFNIDLQINENLNIRNNSLLRMAAEVSKHSSTFVDQLFGKLNDLRNLRLNDLRNHNS